jgi:hypothetical protein
MSHEVTVFKRSQFQNAFRWIAFAMVVAMDIACVASTIGHFVSQGFNVVFLGRQVLSYFLLIVCNCAVLPSIILEARKVEILDDSLVIHNLLYTSTMKWTDIRKVSAPLFLKFAIIRTARGFALINKRDVGGFEDLIQIIREKAEAAPKS